MDVRLDTEIDAAKTSADDRATEDRAADEQAESDAENWVSPYLRRPLRSLDEVLAERRAYEDRLASRDQREPRGRVIRLSSAGKHYGRVA